MVINITKDDLMLAEHTFRNKHIIITGGGTGLGKSMALALSILGAKVGIISRKEEVLKQTSEEISLNTKNEVLYYVADVRQYQDVSNAFDFFENQWGKIDGLINNAAGNFISPTEMLSDKAFDIILDIVLKGTKNCILAFGKKAILKKQAATILNIVTTYATTGSGYVVPSAAAKAGVIAMTKSLAVEWAKYHIRMNAIAPGPFPTEGAWSRLFPETISKNFDYIQKIPLKRVGEHKELANLATYLLSDFSAYINGEIVTIDGGEWLKGAGQFNFLDQLTPEQWIQASKEIRN